MSADEPNERGAPSAAAANQPNHVGAPPLKMGETAYAPAYQLQVLNLKTCPSPAWHQLKAGMVRLGVEVEIVALSDERVPANPFYARLIDAEGKAYRPVFGGCEPDLRHRPLGKNERTRGFISFEAPASSPRFTLRYSPQLPGPDQSLNFDLGNNVGEL